MVDVEGHGPERFNFEHLLTPQCFIDYNMYSCFLNTPLSSALILVMHVFAPERSVSVRSEQDVQGT